MQTVKPYLREAKYYETDQMRVIHHSNYLRWFEEARIDYLGQLGIDFAQLEDSGVASPLLQVEVNYKGMIRFKELVEITVRIVFFNGIRLKFSYEVWDVRSKTLKTTGSTQHCFVNQTGQILSVKKVNPRLYAVLKNQVEQMPADSS